jgi:N-acetylneuraminic acid mutarotase
MVQEFNETNNELILNQAVNFYINEMIPKLKDIQELKYEVNFVEYYPQEQLFKLIQMPTSLESNENTFKEDDKVVKFITGVRKDKKSKTKKVMGVVTKKTRKLRPTGDLVIEEDVEEEVVGENQEVPPNFEDNTTNNNPTYDVPQVVPQVAPQVVPQVAPQDVV